MLFVSTGHHHASQQGISCQQNRAGTRTLCCVCCCRSAGVFIGLSQLEYARITLEQNTPVSAYYATGAHLSVAAGRLSFTWGLTGPAVAVDTACSSSLVTAHLAASALGKGEVTMAAAGGVNLTLASSWSLACNRAGKQTHGVKPPAQMLPM